VTDGFEEPELIEPVQALKNAGPGVTIVSLSSGEVQGVRDDLEKTIKIKVDRTMKEVGAMSSMPVQLPGGAVNADRMRIVPEVQAFLAGDTGRPASLSPRSAMLLGAGFGRPGARTDAHQYHTIRTTSRQCRGQLG